MKSATVAILLAALVNTALAAPYYPTPPKDYDSPSVPGYPSGPHHPEYDHPGKHTHPVPRDDGIPAFLDSIHLDPEAISALGDILARLDKGDHGDDSSSETELLGGTMSRLAQVGDDEAVRGVVGALLRLFGTTGHFDELSYLQLVGANPSGLDLIKDKAAAAGGPLGALGGIGDLASLITGLLQIPISIVQSVLAGLGLGGGKGPLGAVTGGLGGLGGLTGGLTGGLGGGASGGADLGGLTGGLGGAGGALIAGGAGAP